MRERQWMLVVGCGRSGTTMLSDLLCQHPEIYISPETKLLQTTWSQRRLLRLAPRARRNRAILECLLKSEYPRSSPIFPQHRDRLRQQIAACDDYARLLFDIVGELSDRPILGEKSPWHTFFVDSLVARCPNLKVLAICRDAPAVVASHRDRAGFRRVGNLLQCVARWNLFNRELLRLRSQLSDTQFRLVRYEDVLAHPEAELSGIAEWLGVAIDERMLRPTHQDSSLRGKNSADGGFDTDALSRWREHLSDGEVRLIRGLTSDTAYQLGYKATDGASSRARLSLASEEIFLRAAILSMRRGVYPLGALRHIRSNPDKNVVDDQQTRSHRRAA